MGTARAKRYVLVVVGVTALLYAVWPVLAPPELGRPVARELLVDKQRKAREQSSVLALALAVQAYELDNEGFLPYHQAGEEAALYLLKPYLLPGTAPYHPRGAEFFDAQKADNDINGPASFDDMEKRVRNVDYDYINVKGLTWRSATRSLIILAEKPGVRSKSKRYLTLSGEVGEYEFAPGTSVSIVGKDSAALPQAKKPMGDR